MPTWTWHPDTIRGMGFTDTQERITGNAAAAMHHARQLARQRGLGAQSVRAYRLTGGENVWGFFIDPEPQPAPEHEPAMLP